MKLKTLILGLLTILGVCSTSFAQLTRNPQTHLMAMLTTDSPVHSLVISAKLPVATTGVTYSATFTASGGTAPYHFAVASGQLPPGILLSGPGVISGTPSKVGTFTFTISAEDRESQSGTQSFQITVSQAPVVVTISPATATLLSAGTLQFSALVSNASNAAVTWSASSGTISSSGFYQAPTVSGNTTATVTATSAADPTKSATASVTITPPPLSITTTSVGGNRRNCILESIDRHRRHTSLYLDSYFRHAANRNRIAIEWIALGDYHSGWAIHFHREGVGFLFAAAHGLAIFQPDGSATSAQHNHHIFVERNRRNCILEPIDRHRRHSPVYLDSYFRHTANGNRVAIWIALRNHHSSRAIHLHCEGVGFLFAAAHGIAIFQPDGSATSAQHNHHIFVERNRWNCVLEPIDRHRRNSPVQLDAHFRHAANRNYVAIKWIALGNDHAGRAIHFHREGVRFLFAAAHGLAIFHTNGQRTSAPSNFLRILGVGYEWLNLAHCDL